MTRGTVVNGRFDFMRTLQCSEKIITSITSQKDTPELQEIENCTKVAYIEFIEVSHEKTQHTKMKKVTIVFHKQTKQQLYIFKKRLAQGKIS